MVVSTTPKTVAANHATEHAAISWVQMNNYWTLRWLGLIVALSLLSTSFAKEPPSKAMRSLHAMSGSYRGTTKLNGETTEVLIRITAGLENSCDIQVEMGLFKFRMTVADDDRSGPLDVSMFVPAVKSSPFKEGLAKVGEDRVEFMDKVVNHGAPNARLSLTRTRNGLAFKLWDEKTAYESNLAKVKEK